jgi:hypothetical protein
MTLKLLRDLRAIGAPLCYKAADEIERLHNIVQAMSDLDGPLPWHPIETAPPNEVIILTNGGCVYSGFCQKDLGWFTNFNGGTIYMRGDHAPLAWSPMVEMPSRSDQPAQGRPKDGHSPDEAGHE